MDAAHSRFAKTDPMTGACAQRSRDALPFICPQKPVRDSLEGEGRGRGGECGDIFPRIQGGFGLVS